MLSRLGSQPPITLLQSYQGNSGVAPPQLTPARHHHRHRTKRAAHAKTHEHQGKNQAWLQALDTWTTIRHPKPKVHVVRPLSVGTERTVDSVTAFTDSSENASTGEATPHHGGLHPVFAVVSSSPQAAAATQADTSGPTQPITDVIFFPEPGGKLLCHDAMKPGGCRKFNCEYAHGPTHLAQFLKYLGSARETLDVCVFTITCDAISTKVIELHQSGVQVRIITDDDQAKSPGSDVSRFREAGIPVKVDHNKAHMHHKWCLVDRRLFMGGSFNWTRQAVLHNQENVVVLNDPKVLEAFSQQFEKLWEQFYP